MLNPALMHIGDRLNPPVRVPGKPLEVMLRIVGMEIVEQQERIEQGHLVVTECALQVNPRPFQGRLALPDLSDVPYRCHASASLC